MPNLLARIGLFTDSHYAPITYMDRVCPDSLDKLRAAVAHFNAEALDLVIGLGDLVDAAETKAEEIAYLQEMARVYAACHGRRCLVLGNHDVGTLTKAEFLANCGITEARRYYSFNHGPLHVVVLDSNCHADGSDFAGGEFEWDQAYIDPPQLDWLAADLAASAPRPTIVCCHVRLDPGTRPDGERDGHVLVNAPAVREILAAHPQVLAVLQGHDHRGVTARHRGIWYIGLRAMVVGPGLANNAYAVLSVHRDGSLRLDGQGQQASGDFPVDAADTV